MNSQVGDSDDNKHCKVLKSFRNSSEQSRIGIKQTLAVTDKNTRSTNLYQARLAGSASWATYDSPPAHGVEEWIYVDAKGLPMLYWHKQAAGLVLLG